MGPLQYFIGLNWQLRFSGVEHITSSEDLTAAPSKMLEETLVLKNFKLMGDFYFKPQPLKKKKFQYLNTILGSWGALTMESGTGMCRGHDPLFFRPVGAL